MSSFFLKFLEFFICPLSHTCCATSNHADRKSRAAIAAAAARASSLETVQLAKQMVPTSSSSSGSSSSRRHDEIGKVGGGVGGVGGGGTKSGGGAWGGGKGTEEGSSPSRHPQSISNSSKYNPTINTAGDGGDVKVDIARSKVESTDLESDKTIVLRNNDNYNNFNLYSSNVTSDNSRKDKKADTDKDTENENEGDNDMNNDARRVTSTLIRDKDIKQAAGLPHNLTGSFREEKALVSGIFDTTKIRKSGDYSVYPESLSSIGRAGSKSDDKGGGGGGLGYTNIDNAPIMEQKVRLCIPHLPFNLIFVFFCFCDNNKYLIFKHKCV